MSEVAFQFSRHTIQEDGTMENEGSLAFGKEALLRST
jgi:hypothetical protein